MRRQSLRRVWGTKSCREGVVLEAGARIGESPTWASAEKALYWIDVKKPALYRFDPGNGRPALLPTSDSGAFVLVATPLR